MWKKVRLLLAILILLSSSLLLGWSYWPVQQRVTEVLLQPAGMKASSDEDGSEIALLENRWVRLVWPESLRIGDEAAIQLDFESAGYDPALSIQSGNLEDVYETHNLMAEAKLEMAGLRLEPGTPTRESMPPGRAVNFTWMIHATQADEYPGKVWLSLRLLPLDGSQPTQVPVYVGDIIIHTTSLLGLSAGVARLLGWFGVICGCILLSVEITTLLAMDKKKVSAVDASDPKEL